MKISVCIPTYNGALYLEEQLRTILDQLPADGEVIISDDRSTDNTLDIVRSLSDERVKIYSHEAAENPYTERTERGIYTVARNVEHALTKAAGDVIFLADQDDVWLPGKVARMMREIERGVQLVMHNATVVDGDKNVVMLSYFSFSHPSRSWVRFVAKCFYQGASMAFTRQVLQRALPFPELAVSHDHWIACCEWTHGKQLSFINEPLLLYRRHGNNVSPSTGENHNPLSFKLLYRINMLRAVLLALRRK